MKKSIPSEDVEALLGKAFEQEPAAFSLEKWQAEHPEHIRRLRLKEQYERLSIFHGYVETGRRIMKSNYTRAAIAAVLLAGFWFIMASSGKMGLDSVAMADVQKSINEQRTCRIQGVRHFTVGEKGTMWDAMDQNKDGSIDLKVTKYVSQDYGYVDQTFSEDGRLLLYVAVHSPDKSVTILLPTRKQYICFHVPASSLPLLSNLTPENWMDFFFRSGEYKTIEPQKIQGTWAAGFEVDDVFKRTSSGLGFAIIDALFGAERSSVRMWVNPRTHLPIQLDADCRIERFFGIGFKDLSLKEVDDSFEWTPVLDEGLFRPDVPADYTPWVMPGQKAAICATTGVGLTGVASMCLLFYKTRGKKKAQRGLPRDVSLRRKNLQKE